MARAEGEEKGDSFARPKFWSRVRPGGVSETGAEHFGVDDAGIDGNGGHALGKFLGERVSQTFDGKFGGTIGSDLGRSGLAPTGTEVGDDAGAALDHGGDEMA